ncbi:acid protease [Gyrodon lividus]|nr:acid protease [Gyrodon lividus]
MHFTFATVIAALLFFVDAAPQHTKQGGAVIPLSKRSSLLNADKSVNLEALRSHVGSTRAKILRGLDNFEKNTGAPHPSAVKGAQKRDSGPIPLSSSAGFWYGVIEVGVPANTYTVVFDTGSGHVFVIYIYDLFLPGPSCNYGSHPYNPSTSLTSADIGEQFIIEYQGDDHVFGDLYIDIISIAELETEQIFGVASHYPPSLSTDVFPADGVLGMAFSAASTFYANTVLENLIATREADEGVFALSLASSGAELYIGGTNPAMYTGEFAYTPVIVAGFWQVTMENVLANEETVLSNVGCIIDTGSELIHGLPDDVAALYAAIGGIDASDIVGDGYYTFPCDNVPTVNFTFGGTSFSIPADTLNLGPVSSDSSACIGGILADNLDTESWVIGNAFLKNVYTVFDFDNMRVGFATLRSSLASTPMFM